MGDTMYNSTFADNYYDFPSSLARTIDTPPPPPPPPQSPLPPSPPPLPLFLFATGYIPNFSSLARAAPDEDDDDDDDDDDDEDDEDDDVRQ
ncbi:hypothetical protein V1478_015857 [Vespula squamosa]|uniref:Uncharacterized protein n=1 Tax=Vespula squamosa TaxID=30214 RepID=A0ABD2A2G8_VESSQ